MRTYLIEPQGIFLPYMQSILQRVGCEVVATSRDVDLVHIAEHAPATIFVDVDYLGSSGPSILCRIRESAWLAILLAFTENEASLYRAACIVSGASAVFSKSTDAEKLVPAIRYALTEARPRTRLR